MLLFASGQLKFCPNGKAIKPTNSISTNGKQKNDECDSTITKQFNQDDKSLSKKVESLKKIESSKQDISNDINDKIITCLQQAANVIAKSDQTILNLENIEWIIEVARNCFRKGEHQALINNVANGYNKLKARYQTLSQISKNHNKIKPQYSAKTAVNMRNDIKSGNSILSSKTQK